MRLSEVMHVATLKEPSPLRGGDEDTVVVHNRASGRDVHLTSREVAKLMIVTIADYIEQMVEVNGWRDHHQVERPLSLFPGDGKPTVALYWMSAICRAVRENLEVVPPVFEGCTSAVAYKEEVAARDLYWRVVTREVELDEDEQLALLTEAAALNPFIGEPLVLAAQLHFRAGRNEQALQAAAAALERMYSLATAGTSAALTPHGWDTRGCCMCARRAGRAGSPLCHNATERCRLGQGTFSRRSRTSWPNCLEQRGRRRHRAATGRGAAPTWSGAFVERHDRIPCAVPRQ